MANSLKKILTSAGNYLQQLIDHIRDSQYAGNWNENFNLDDFHLTLENAVQEVSRATKQIRMAFTGSSFPKAKESQELICSIEGAADCLVSVYNQLPKKLGFFFHHDVYNLVNGILVSVLNFVLSLNSKGSRGLRQIKKGANHVFMACKEIHNLPKNNLKSILNVLFREEVFLSNSMEDLRQEIRRNSIAESPREEVDNTKMWSYQQRQLLSPCITLIRTSQFVLKEITSSVEDKACSSALNNIPELDNIALLVENLGTSIDDFVVAIYPPMCMYTLEDAARDVINVIHKLLNQFRDSHFATEDDQKWISSHLRTVDLDNNRLQPLFSRNFFRDSDD